MDSSPAPEGRQPNGWRYVALVMGGLLVGGSGGGAIMHARAAPAKEATPDPVVAVQLERLAEDTHEIKGLLTEHLTDFNRHRLDTEKRITALENRNRRNE